MAANRSLNYKDGMRHNTDFNKPGKHCHNCKWLEWMEGDIYDPSGWGCNDRDYDSVKEESAHLFLLDQEKYRFKGKRCFKEKR